MRALYTLILLIQLLPFLLKAQAQVASDKAIFSRSDSLRGSLSPLRSCYDINFYHLDVKFNLHEKFISGSNQFKFTAVQDFNKLQFDLFANLQIEKIVYHQNSLPFEREGNAVFVTFPRNIKQNTKDQFTVFYSGKPAVAARAPRDGGFTFATDSLGQPFVATTCEGTGASIWWPNKDHLSDEVDSMAISISVPTGLKSVSNGRLRKVTALKNGYTRFDWFVVNPINNYNVAANIANYIHIGESYNGEKGKLSLDYWVLPEHADRAKAQFGKNVKAMLTTYEHWFGPYPFYKDGYKLIETPYIAMEHQSAISYGGFMKGAPNNDLNGGKNGGKWDFIIVHESAHEWFGNNITAKDLADLWIHESFASYAESLFIENQYGKQAGVAYIHDGYKGMSNDKPVVAVYGVNQLGSGDMYAKGSAVLNMVRTIINDDEKWRKILRGLNSNFYHQTVTYNQIVDYISKQSDVNFWPMFDQYLHYKTIPQLEFASKDGQLICRWQADAKNFSMPVRVKINGGPYQFISPNITFQPLLMTGATLQNIEVDTLNYYLDVLKN